MKQPAESRRATIVERVNHALVAIGLGEKRLEALKNAYRGWIVKPPIEIETSSAIHIALNAKDNRLNQ